MTFMFNSKVIYQKQQGRHNNNKPETTINPLSANPTKWSNTLKQFVGCCRRIV